LYLHCQSLVQHWGLSQMVLSHLSQMVHWQERCLPVTSVLLYLEQLSWSVQMKDFGVEIFQSVVINVALWSISLFSLFFCCKRGYTCTKLHKMVTACDISNGAGYEMVSYCLKKVNCLQTLQNDNFITKQLPFSFWSIFSLLLLTKIWIIYIAYILNEICLNQNSMF
jgi:hypothetical protein